MKLADAAGGSNHIWGYIRACSDAQVEIVGSLWKRLVRSAAVSAAHRWLAGPLREGLACSLAQRLAGGTPALRTQPCG